MRTPPRITLLFLLPLMIAMNPLAESKPIFSTNPAETEIQEEMRECMKDHYGITLGDKYSGSGKLVKTEGYGSVYEFQPPRRCPRMRNYFVTVDANGVIRRITARSTFPTPQEYFPCITGVNTGLFVLYGHPDKKAIDTSVHKLRFWHEKGFYIRYHSSNLQRPAVVEVEFSLDAFHDQLTPF